jgi:hypothetical protein
MIFAIKYVVMIYVTLLNKEPLQEHLEHFDAFLSACDAKILMSSSDKQAGTVEFIIDAEFFTQLRLVKAFVWDYFREITVNIRFEQKSTHNRNISNQTEKLAA